ncbi:MAG: hypothetical protein Q7U47_13220 [Paludibacter sp.]|nr:hypothetical protein [Paludibacter sp.]
MMDIEHKYNWTEWKSFPDPRKGEFLTAPFGFGVYQLHNYKTNEFILFGSANNLAYRMSSLLPKPYGQGTRNNKEKRIFVFENIENIKYRTIAFTMERVMKECEKELRQLKIHKFNT